MNFNDKLMLTITSEWSPTGRPPGEYVILSSQGTVRPGPAWQQDIQSTVSDVVPRTLVLEVVAHQGVVVIDWAQVTSFICKWTGITKESNF